MAKMIPDILPESIENNGERHFYAAARELPDEYTILYSFKYQLSSDVRNGIGEADFVIQDIYVGASRARFLLYVFGDRELVKSHE